ncbi:metalloregulator ArsR/SmtB family transcription factor [Mesorhizobium sp. M0488]|uniref:ArsR/SmtB family transcription factor n=1 Tax=unclassified Mesorhizobium TaxID=325217 RepID=UPI003336250C
MHVGYAASAAALLSVMANDKRLLALDLLTRSEMSVGELAKLVGLSASALSQHLRKLRQLGLVTTRRHQQTIYYSCASEPVQAIISLLLREFGKSRRL